MNAKRYICKLPCFYEGRAYKKGEYLRPGIKPIAKLFVDVETYAAIPKAPIPGVGTGEVPLDEPKTLSEVLERDNKNSETPTVPDAAKGDKPSSSFFD